VIFLTGAIAELICPGLDNLQGNWLCCRADQGEPRELTEADVGCLKRKAGDGTLPAVEILGMTAGPRGTG